MVYLLYDGDDLAAVCETLPKALNRVAQRHRGQNLEREQSWFCTPLPNAPGMKGIWSHLNYRVEAWTVL